MNPSSQTDLQQSSTEPPNYQLATISLALGLSSFFFSILTGIPAVVCGHMARAKIKRDKGALGGNDRASTGLILGYASIAFAIFVAVVTTPVILDRLEMAERATNAHNAKQTYIALFDYHDDFGTFPDSLDQLVTRKLITQENLDSYKPKNGGEWQYFPGQSFDSGNTNILLAAPKASGGLWIVLRIDGSVKQLKDIDYQVSLRAQQQP